MRDPARIAGIKGRCAICDKGQKRHRRKGGGRDATNVARRAQDRAEAEQEAICEGELQGDGG